MPKKNKRKRGHLVVSSSSDSDELPDYILPPGFQKDDSEMIATAEDDLFIDDSTQPELTRSMVRILSLNDAQVSNSQPIVVPVRHPHPVVVQAVASSSNAPQPTNNRLKKRSYCFTYNNPTHTPAQLEAILQPHAQYYVFQYEKAPDTGTLHFQGFIHLKASHRTSWMQNHLFKCAWFWARGTDQQNQDYCSKSDSRISGPWEWGKMSKGKGERTDIVRCIELCKAGATWETIFEECPHVAMKYQKGISMAKALNKPPRAKDFTVRVELHYGPTGAGKSYHCIHENGTGLDPWRPMISKELWFDGYDRNKVVLLDDFGGASCHVFLVHLLKLLDNYVVKVQVKGLSCWFNPELIMITSNRHPDKWYNWDNRMEEKAALCRRFDSIYVYTTQGVVPKEIKDKQEIKNWFNLQADEDGLSIHFNT